MGFEYIFKNIDEVLSRISGMYNDRNVLLLQYVTDIFEVEGDNEWEAF